MIVRMNESTVKIMVSFSVVHVSVAWMHNLQKKVDEWKKKKKNTTYPAFFYDKSSQKNIQLDSSSQSVDPMNLLHPDNVCHTILNLLVSTSTTPRGSYDKTHQVPSVSFRVHPFILTRSVIWSTEAQLPA